MGGEMSSRMTSLLLGLLAVVAVAFVFWLLSGPGRTPPVEDEDPDLIRRPEALVAPDTPRPGTPAAETPEGVPTEEPTTAVVPAGTTDLVGLRDPEGIDLTDHRQAMERLGVLLDQNPVDWKAVPSVFVW